MEPSYEWLSLGNTPEAVCRSSVKGNVIDIMGAPIEDPSIFMKKIDSLIRPHTTLCISGELKECGEGQPASNYRCNRDEVLNNAVLCNYFYLFRKYHELTSGNPIIVTTIPRSWRKYSFLIRENGTIIRKDQEFRREGDEGGQFYYTGFPGGNKEGMDEEATDLMKFLCLRGVSLSALTKIRESCKGAGYNTYLIDMISFLFQIKIDSSEFHSLFSPDYRNTELVRGGESVGNGPQNVK